jgi:hypothetical protein
MKMRETLARFIVIEQMTPLHWMTVLESTGVLVSYPLKYELVDREVDEVVGRFASIGDAGKFQTAMNLAYHYK